MATFDHLGITVDDVPRASAQFHPVFEALGYTRAHDAPDHAYWRRTDEPEILLYPAREGDTGPHVHGRVGWQQRRPEHEQCGQHGRGDLGWCSHDGPPAGSTGRKTRCHGGTRLPLLVNGHGPGYSFRNE